MKREREPTSEEFEKVLRWLNPDRDEGGRKLSLLQARLTQIFMSRGCVDAASLADEVTNRIAVRIDAVIATYSDPLRCCMGFVENVYREYVREQRRHAAAREPPQPRPSEELEREDRCLKQCLEDLPERDRELVMRYFCGDGRGKIEARKKLAAELNITPNALRIQAHRLRKKLRQCVQRCLERT